MPRNIKQDGPSENENIENTYRYLFDMTLHESKFAWDTGNVFLIANTILSGFVGATFWELIKYPRIESRNFLLVIAVMGLIFSFLWFSSLYRITMRQKYWMAKIVEFEINSRDKTTPKLFSGDSKILADGGVVKVGCQKFDLKIFGKIHIPSQSALKCVILLYVAFYLLIMLAPFVILK